MVAGYAPLALTVSDQTGAICPLLESETTPKAKSQKMQSAASQKHPAQLKEAKYKIRSDAKPESAFLLVSVSFKRRWQVCQIKKMLFCNKLSVIRLKICCMVFAELFLCCK